MKHRWSLGWCMAGLMAAGTAMAWQQLVDVPFLGGFLRETRIVYPLAAGGWTAVDEHRYDDPAAGVSIRYAWGKEMDRWIDLYFYPVGVLAKSQAAQVAAQEREGLSQARLMAGDPAPEMSPLQSFAIAKAGDKPGDSIEAYSMDLEYSHDGERKNSAMIVYMDRMYMVKGRYSADPRSHSRVQLRRELEAFARGIALQTTISSYGACWMPLPIEQIKAGEQAPGDALLTMQGPAGTKELVYKDRVLSAHPDGVAAKAAMLVGMAMQGRLFVGCDGDTPANPVVPEGKREIRIEYPPPLDQGAPQAPVRTPHRGVG